MTLESGARGSEAVRWGFLAPTLVLLCTVALAFEFTYRKYCLHNSPLQCGKRKAGKPGNKYWGAGRAASSPGDYGGSRQGMLFSLVTASRESDPTFHQRQVQEPVSSQPDNQSPEF